METREQNDRETTATAVVEEDCRASYVLVGAAGTVKARAVGEDRDKPVAEQRVRVEIGDDLAVFIRRDAIPSLVLQLLAVQAMTPVNA